MLTASTMHQSSQLWLSRPRACCHPWGNPPPLLQSPKPGSLTSFVCPTQAQSQPCRRVWRAVAEEHQSGQAAMQAPPGPQDMPQPTQEEESGEYEAYNEDGTDPNTALMQSLPGVSNVRIRSSEYVTSSVEPSQCPPPRFPEFAVIGRSNVGKSSLINMLTNNKRLAHVSKEPGKTKCINHFIINDNWYLVDLPGYGYARTGFSSRDSFDKFTKQYFLKRRSLAMVYLLIDSSLAPQAIDLEYAAWLHSKRVPFSLVFTKADKRKKRQPPCRENVAAFQQALVQEHGLTDLPTVVITSSETGLGRTPLLHLTCCLRDSFAASSVLEAAMSEWQKAQAALPQPQASVLAGSKSKSGSSSSKTGKGKSAGKRKLIKPLPGDDIPLPPTWKVRARDSEPSKPAAPTTTDRANE